MNKGIIYLIPTPISSNRTMFDILPPMYLDILSDLEYFVTESPKTARAFLKDIPLKRKMQNIKMSELSEHTEDVEISELLQPIMEGHNLGVMSDAGVPTIADPGYRLVSLAQRAGIQVVPFVGPSSILLSLMASGLNGQSFSFNGYLPKENGLKRKKIKSLERIALGSNQTQIFMETPYKNQHMFEDILDVCEYNTHLCIAMNIMGDDEYIVTKRIAEWKKTNVSLDKKPCLFLINR